MNPDALQSYEPESDEERELLKRLITFYSNESSVLLSRYQHIENLLGLRHHSGSEGDFCEDLLRQFLRQVLPGRLSVDYGFIRHTPRHRFALPCRVSRQLDVIIHDTHDYAPIFRSGEFVIVLPQAVSAVIEVKKTLDSGELKDALDNLAVAKAVLEEGSCDFRTSFTGIFGFSEAEEMQTETKPFSDTYPNRIREACQKHAAWTAVPDSIVVAGRHIFYREIQRVIGAPRNEWHCVMRRPVIHEERDVSVQAFLNVLFQKLQLAEMSGPSGRFIFPGQLSFQQVIFRRLEAQIG